jgi:hypothetical protein
MHRSHDNLVKYAVPLRAESDSETRVHESSVWVLSRRLVVVRAAPIFDIY